MAVRRAYEVSPVPIYSSWTGLYLGANAGYSWGQSKFDGTFAGGRAASDSEKINGAIGGVQSGYNHQFGAWVFGWEADFQASGEKGGSTFPGAIAVITTDHKLEWFGTARSRLGFLATQSILLYGTAGVAYGQVKDSATVTLVGIGSGTGTFKDVKAGWTAGGGVEGLLGNGWSAKLEYLYMDLGKTEQTLASPVLGGTVATETRRTTDNIVRAGLNYRWGGR
jgi:outer membrane immunogenic protein